MSAIHDSEISNPTNHETDHTHSVVIHVEDLSGEGEPVEKDPSPDSINSSLAGHITVPTSTVDGSHSNISNIAQSTTVLDVDDGAIKETIKRNYKKLRENIFLGIVIAILCGFFLTPVILFYTRPNISNPFANTTVRTSCQKVSSG